MPRTARCLMVAVLGIGGCNRADPCEFVPDKATCADIERTPFHPPPTPEAKLVRGTTITVVVGTRVEAPDTGTWSNLRSCAPAVLRLEAVVPEPGSSRKTALFLAVAPGRALVVADGNKQRNGYECDMGPANVLPFEAEVRVVARS